MIYALFGNPLRTGYGGQNAADLFVVPFSTGLYGLTISSGKGLLWYSPPLVLAIVGWWPFWRRCRAEASALPRDRRWPTWRSTGGSSPGTAMVAGGRAT